MRDRLVRVAFVGLILVFPLLMVLANPRTSTARQAALSLLLIESVLAVGLSTAARDRRRLRADRQLDQGVGDRVVRNGCAVIEL